jgi:phospholipid/cholesterol/gamma-HCH transport system substrate-binding protein
LPAHVETRVGMLILAAIAIFLFMGFQIGVFRFDQKQYAPYTLYLQDCSGLIPKAPVKIAGVKVGWIADIILEPSQKNHVRTTIMIQNKYQLYKDASAAIRQEGLLGSKYLEIIPGGSLHTILPAGSILQQPIESPIGVEEIMVQCKQILQQTSQVIEIFSNRMQQCLHEDHIKTALEIGDSIKKLSDSCNDQLIPIAQDTCLQVKENFKNISAEINTAVSGVKNIINRADSYEFVFDSHLEFMLQKAENYPHHDNKGFFNVRVHPSENYFYLIQVNYSERGYASRHEIQQTFFDSCDNQMRQTLFQRFNWRVGLQLGKIMGNYAVRAGVFENTFGIALDWQLPIPSDAIRWVSTFEMYELTGWNRVHDRRPHLKWINRLFLWSNIYFVFGADDFISKKNRSAFLGGGIRFGDDDFNYILSTMPINFMRGTLPVDNAR